MLSRTFRRRRRRVSRDADSFAPVSSGRPREVPLPRFRREVVALLVAARSGGKRLDSTQALRLVIRWDRMVRLRHSQGKPPCNVADHILKYEKDQAVCPCGNALPSPLSGQRDKERGSCRRCSAQGARGSRRDPGKYPKFQTKIYRNCSCGETIHKYTGFDDEKRGMIYECYNCRHKVYSKPGWFVRAKARARERKS